LYKLLLEKRRTFGKEKNKVRPNRGIQDYDWKKAISTHKFFEVSMESRTRKPGYMLYKNKLGPRGIDFSVRGW